MTNNSPKAQEVKLLPCPFCGKAPMTHSRLEEERLCLAVACFHCGISMTRAAPDGDGKDRFYGIRIGSKRDLIEAWNTRAPNENQPPLAEKTPTTPQLSGLPAQSEGNREKELEDALEWLCGSNISIGKECGVNRLYFVLKFSNHSGVTIGEGSTPLEAIQNAMNSQGASPPPNE